MNNLCSKNHRKSQSHSRAHGKNIKSKWITGISIKCVTIKPQEENTREGLLHQQIIGRVLNSYTDTSAHTTKKPNKSSKHFLWGARPI